MEEYALRPESRLAEALGFANGRKRLSLRLASKSFRLLYNWLSGDEAVEYARSKELMRRGFPSETEGEARFLLAWERFWAELRSSLSEKPRRNDWGETLEEGIRRIAEECSGQDRLQSIEAMHCRLLSLGLWIPVFRGGDRKLAEKAASGDGPSLLAALLASPPPPETPPSTLAVGRREAEGFCRLLLQEGWARRVFLCGSFLDVDSLGDSDVDIEIVFTEGLSGEEKRACLEKASELCRKSLSRACDACEAPLLAGAPIHPHPTYLEVVEEGD